MFEYTDLTIIERDSVNEKYRLASHIADGIPLKDMKIGLPIEAYLALQREHWGQAQRKFGPCRSKFFYS